MKPVTIRSWSLVGDLNGIGEAVMIVTVDRRGIDPHVLILGINPRTLEVMRVARLVATGEAAQVDRHTLPFGLRDLAETVVRERFPAYGPTRHSAR